MCKPISETRRGRSATKMGGTPGPSRQKSADDESSAEDGMEVDGPPTASVMTEKCSVCIASGEPVCEKTGAQGACSTCAEGKKRCSLKDRVNAYWKSIGKIGNRSRSRSKSRAPSERKTPRMYFIQCYYYPLILTIPKSHGKNGNRHPKRMMRKRVMDPRVLAVCGSSR
jgi:hypothetical protein